MRRAYFSGKYRSSGALADERSLHLSGGRVGCTAPKPLIVKGFQLLLVADLVCSVQHGFDCEGHEDDGGEGHFISRCVSLFDEFILR